MTSRQEPLNLRNNRFMQWMAGTNTHCIGFGLKKRVSYHNNDVGVKPIRNERLGAVQDVVRAVLHRVRANCIQTQRGKI